MDQGNSTTGIELPLPGSAPRAEQGPITDAVPLDAGTHERLPQVGNVPGGAPMQPVVQFPTNTAPAGPPPLSSPVAAQPPAAGPILPVTADDSDLIEREWVMKAKEIVERTRHDPYRQNKEINQVKAAYIKRRYNRDISVAGS